MSRQLLAPFCQSLLRVDVCVTVTLAEKRLPLEQVLRLVPGVMIQFEKPCESPMTIEVGEQPIAHGEVVKIGDKFGVRINEILTPAERFIKLQPQEPTRK